MKSKAPAQWKIKGDLRSLTKDHLGLRQNNAETDRTVLVKGSCVAQAAE